MIDVTRSLLLLSLVLLSLFAFVTAEESFYRNLPLNNDPDLTPPTFRLGHILQNSFTSQKTIRFDIKSDHKPFRNLNPDDHDTNTKSNFQSSWWQDLVSIPTKYQKIQRIVDSSPLLIESYLNHIQNYGYDIRKQMKNSLQWEEKNILIPDMDNKTTFLSLATMSADAYIINPWQSKWRNTGPPWPSYDSPGIGWDDDGVRGHIFVSDKSPTQSKQVVIIAFKGTSSQSFDGNSDTVTNDRINDNLLFSCCCARVTNLWTTVCDCYSDIPYTCSKQCLGTELLRKDRYFSSAMEIYKNVTALYPKADIWLTGHSLGGVLAALVGRAFQIPAVSFESPGERLPAERLGLPVPPNNGNNDYFEPIWHIGHNADPIYLGVCNGPGSTCALGGYAMETMCHTGLECIYDVVTEKGWHVNILNHRIITVIDEVIATADDIPECKLPPACEDCFNWNFIEEPATSTSIPVSPTEPPKKGKCIRWTWYGKCLEYEDDDGVTTTSTTTEVLQTSTRSTMPHITTPGDYDNCKKKIFGKCWDL